MSKAHEPTPPAIDPKVLDEAVRRALAGMTAPGRASPGPTAASAVAAFLAWAEGRVRVGKMKPACLRCYRRAALPFAAHFGDRPLAQLEREEIEDWAALPRPVPGKNRKKLPPRPWSASTQNGYLGVVLMVFKKTKCPITLELPSKESRGAAVVLTDEQFAAVLAEVGQGGRAGDLAALLRALRETGARPGELSGLTAAAVDWPNGVVRLVVHKTKRQTGADRIIVLSPAALAVLQVQREKYKGAGLLFRNREGAAYTAPAIGKRLRAVSRRLGYRAIAYGLGRHSWATDKLKKGMPDSMVAAALGQRGTATLHKHYAHLTEDVKAIREAMDRADRGSPAAR